MRWILLVVLLVAGNVATAAAQTSDTYCRFYFGEEEYISPEIREILSSGHGSAVRLCRGAGLSGPPIYHLISRPSRGAFEVCQMTQWRLTKEAGSLQFMPSESSSPGFPMLFMMVSEGDCPRQDDPRYIPTDDVTAGVFVAAARFWEQMSSSEDGLQELLAMFRAHEHFARDLEDFERDFRKGEVRLSAVRLGGDDKRTAPHFALDLGRSGTFWSLLVDFEDDDLVVIGLGMTIVD